MSSLIFNIKAMYDCLFGKSPVRPTADELQVGGVYAAQTSNWSGSLLNPVEMALNEREIAKLASLIRQLKFLLAMAPMMNAPSKSDADLWFPRVSTPYGYMHPKTLAQYSTLSLKIHGFIQFEKSPTKWVLTSLMPEGTVLLAQELGVESEL